MGSGSRLELVAGRGAESAKTAGQRNARIDRVSPNRHDIEALLELLLSIRTWDMHLYILLTPPYLPPNETTFEGITSIYLVRFDYVLVSHFSELMINWTWCRLPDPVSDPTLQPAACSLQYLTIRCVLDISQIINGIRLL